MPTVYISAPPSEPASQDESDECVVVDLAEARSQRQVRRIAVTPAPTSGGAA